LNLVKTSDGLLEVENFYLTSSFNDFLGFNNASRDTENFYIKGNSKIERNFNYNDFVIELYKLNWDTMDTSDSFVFYIVSTLNNIYGTKDDITNGESQYLKIISDDNYIQTYSSVNRKNWNNIGGIGLQTGETIDKQGFQKISSKDITIKDYKVYSNPYVTIQNLPENYKVELYNESDQLIKTRLFDINLQANVFLDYCGNGYFKFYDINNNLIYTSDLLYLQYGDIYTFTDYELELFYKNNDISKDIDTFLDTDMVTLGRIEEVVLKNSSISSDYTKLCISAKTGFDDTIQLSLDNITYANTVTINSIEHQQEITIYIQMIRGATNHNFISRNFQLCIDKVDTSS
jgi:hypothetical protein